MIHVYGDSLNDNHYNTFKDKVVSAAGDVYLHGKLEDENGYDICFLSEYPEEDGEYPCICLLANGKSHIARLFFWRVNDRPRGYVVAQGDKEYLLDAKVDFDKRAEYI